MTSAPTLLSAAVGPHRPEAPKFGDLHLISRGNHGARSLALAQAGGESKCREQIEAKEVQQGQSIDSRVSLEVLRKLCRLREKAHAEFQESIDARADGREMPVRAFFAPTSRILDHVVGPEAVQALIRSIMLSGEGDRLRELIRVGPGHGQVIWEQPATPLELVATLVRWAYLREADKKRIRVGQELRAWVADTLAAAQVPHRSKLGGVAAVGSLLATALQHKPTMLALGALPQGVREAIPGDLAIINEKPSLSRLEELPSDPGEPGHFCICSFGEERIMPLEFGPFLVGEREFSGSEKRPLDILITGSSAPKGFGTLSLGRIRGIGKGTDVAILSGMQHLSTDAEVVDYVCHFDTLHQAGAPTALFYAEPRSPTHELSALRLLCTVPAVDLFALNSFEVVGLLARILEDGDGRNGFRLTDEAKAQLASTLQLAQQRPVHWEDGHEDPAWIASSARALQVATRIPIVRVRGKALDVVVLDSEFTEEDAREVVNAQIVSRDLATLKVALPSGLIAARSDIAPLTNIPRGEYVAALARGADSCGVSAADIFNDGFSRLPDGRWMCAVAPIQFYVRDGGTQSAGDVADGTFATEIARTVLKKARSLGPR